MTKSAQILSNLIKLICGCNFGGKVWETIRVSVCSRHWRVEASLTFDETSCA